MSTNTAKFTNCLCGCGQPVKSSYKQGHDAKHVSLLVQAVHLGKMDATSARGTLGSLALQAKFDRAMLTIQAKANRAARTLATKAAKNNINSTCDCCDKDGAELTHDETFDQMVCPACSNLREIKIGRWWYPVRTISSGVATYAKRDGSEAEVEVKGHEVRIGKLLDTTA